MNWKLCLAVLTCNVLFMSSSYTMIIPFLPVYLTKELGVIPADIHLWSGIIFSASFIVSSVMAPIGGRMADNRGKRLMALRASFLLSISLDDSCASVDNMLHTVVKPFLRYRPLLCGANF